MSAKVYASVVCQWQGNQDRKEAEGKAYMYGCGKWKHTHTTYICTYVHTKHYRKVNQSWRTTISTELCYFTHQRNTDNKKACIYRLYVPLYRYIDEIW